MTISCPKRRARLTWAAALYDWLRVTEDRVACILTGAGGLLGVHLRLFWVGRVSCAPFPAFLRSQRCRCRCRCRATPPSEISPYVQTRLQT